MMRVDSYCAAGMRANSDTELCDTKFTKFYPVCYTDEPDMARFGPTVKPGAGEEFFDPAKASAADAGISQEDFCKAQNPLDFCSNCIEPQWFDSKVVLFVDQPTCWQCFDICIDYYHAIDIKNFNTTSETSRSCDICMSARGNRSGSPPQDPPLPRPAPALARRRRVLPVLAAFGAWRVASGCA